MQWQGRNTARNSAAWFTPEGRNTPHGSGSLDSAAAWGEAIYPAVSVTDPADSARGCSR